MMMLGGFVFQNFEIPEKIDFGTKQTLKVHKTIGGVRTIDAMGPDPNDIHWSGIFEGAGASDRATQLELIAEQGAQLTLVWNDFSREVVVGLVDCQYGKPWHVEYSITCTPLDPEGANGSNGAGVTLDSAVDADLSSALSSISSFDPSGLLTSALDGLSAAVSSVGTLQGSFGSVLQPVVDAASSAQAVFGDALSSVTDAIDQTDAFGIAAGAAPPTLADSLLAQASALNTMAAINNAAGYVGRIVVNLGNAPG